jgi:hypothetical protein
MIHCLHRLIVAERVAYILSAWPCVEDTLLALCAPGSLLLFTLSRNVTVGNWAAYRPDCSGAAYVLPAVGVSINLPAVSAVIVSLRLM